MTIHQELKKIKSLPYKVANASEKLEMIKAVLANDHSFLSGLMLCLCLVNLA